MVILWRFYYIISCHKMLFCPSHMDTLCKYKCYTCLWTFSEMKPFMSWHKPMNIGKPVTRNYHVQVCRAAVKYPALLFVTGRGGCLPVLLLLLLLLLVQWAQLIPQLCLSVLKDILRQTHGACTWLRCGGQKATHSVSDQELFIKEKAAILLEPHFIINMCSL